MNNNNNDNHKDHNGLRHAISEFQKLSLSKRG